MKHFHFHYTHFLYMFILDHPTFCTIKSCCPYCCPIKFSCIRTTYSMHSSTSFSLYSMVEISIQFFVLLQDRSRITKASLFGTSWSPTSPLSHLDPYFLWTCTMYTAFDLLRRKHLDCNTSCQTLSLSFTLLCFIYQRSIICEKDTPRDIYLNISY